MSATVKRGSKGGHIATLNAALFKKGYKKVPPPNDPKAAQEFTVETEKAVKDIQKKYGLKPTGVCDVNGVIFALGKKPADFNANPTDYRPEAAKYTKRNDDNLMKADRQMKNISDEIRNMNARLDEIKSRFGEAISNEFNANVFELEERFWELQRTNEFINRYELVQDIQKYEKKIPASLKRVEQEISIAAKYTKELEAVVRQLKSVGK